MPKQLKRAACAAGAVLPLFLAAVALRVAAYYSRPLYSAGLGLPRTGIYLFLFAWWGVSVRRRIIQTQVRRYLTAIAALMVFWFTVRTVKYFFVTDPDTARLLWYSYYVPMTFIPLLVLFAALSLGRPESYRLPRRTAFFYLAAGCLAALVLTNDLHRFVFTFSGSHWTDHNNGYAFGYWLAVGWGYLCAGAAIAVMLARCRVPRSRRMIWLPMIPPAAAGVYQFLYLSGAKWLRVVFGDMSLVVCLLTIAELESCIWCGLIQSNTHYAELFRVSAVKAQITDREYRVLLSSEAAESFPAEVMRRTEAAPVLLENGVRLSGAPLRGGYVLWEDDVSELLRVLDELRDTRESLEDGNSLLKEEYLLKAREAHIAEQNRLFQKMQRETAKQTALLAGLTERFEASGTEEERIRLLGKMIVVGAYLKRRNNLIFSSEKAPSLDPGELELAFSESLDNLRLCGVACGFRSEITEPIPAPYLMRMYDFFEQIVERSFDCMSAAAVFAGKEGTSFLLVVNIDSAADFTGFAVRGADVVRDEDGEWQLSMRLCPEGGAS